jgi:uncharacterized RDD family membrane protein YckC
MTTGDFEPQPAQPAETEAPEPSAPAGAEPGSLGVRLGARIIDSIIIYIVAVAIGLLLRLVTTYSEDAFLFALINGIIAGVLTFAYFVGFETSKGQTPGKKLLGLSVRGPGGAHPTLQQSAIRNVWTLFTIVPPQFVGALLYLISVVAIAVTINGSPTKQGIHDRLAGGTEVVKG